MAQAALECANIALTKIGAAQIAALNGTEETAKACNLCLDPLRKALLRRHPWNFAVKRKYLTPTLITHTSILDTTPVGINAQTHGLATGEWVTVSGVTVAPTVNGHWQVTVVNVDTITLGDSTAFGTGSQTSDGDMWKSQPPDGYSYMHALPSDFLRLLRADPEGVDYRLESNKFCTNEPNPVIRYIYDVTDYTLMDVEFYDLLSTCLALEIAYKITQSSTLVEQLSQMYRKQVSSVRFTDATEDPAEHVIADDWINSRFNTGSGWPIRLS